MQMFFIIKVEPIVRFEPTTYSLQMSCTTTVLNRLKMAPKVGSAPTTSELTVRHSAD